MENCTSHINFQNSIHDSTLLGLVPSMVLPNKTLPDGKWENASNKPLVLNYTGISYTNNFLTLGEISYTNNLKSGRVV